MAGLEYGLDVSLRAADALWWVTCGCCNQGCHGEGEADVAGGTEWTTGAAVCPG